MTTLPNVSWRKRCIFTLAALAILSNLTLIVYELWSDTNSSPSLAGAGDQTKLRSPGAVLETPAYGVFGKNLEPAAGEVEISSEEPEYLGDGNVPPEPRGLGLPDIKVSKATTFSHLDDVIEMLAKRRKYLKEYEDDLYIREQLVAGKQAVLDEKLNELSAIRDEIDALIEKKSAEEEKQLDQLVKIYEGMKSKKAATIFNSLEMKVLYDVSRRMREAKFAAILQSMEPQRAKLLTERLAKKTKPLP